MTAIIHNKAMCKRCNSIIESAHRHDFQSCVCGAIFVDGGTDYLRRGGDIDAIEDLSSVYTQPTVAATPIGSAMVQVELVQNNSSMRVLLTKKDVEKLLFELDCAYAELLFNENR